MEALPAMPMMAPQFRTSTLSYDNIPNFDFRLRMKEFILLSFNADPHDYDSAFDELAQMKFEANIPTASVEQICKLKRYYGQLCMMQKRFPMGTGEQLETPFAWHDGILDMRSAQSEVSICDIEFEKASVMFNIGACHAQYAADQPRETQDSIKSAFMHFQYAAYAFEQLNSFRNSDIFYPSVDLDANVIAFYYKVLIAQAQECLVQKSLLDNRSAIVIAKLSLWLQDVYDSAAKIVDKWTINIPERVQKYYAKMCRLKSDIYGVIAYMSMGDHSEKEEKKMGWRLEYYNIAMKFMDELTANNAKMRERYPELFVATSFLFDVISAKQKNAEKENDFIYHDRVPKREEAMDAAKKDGAMCKVKTLSFDPLDPSVCGSDLFGKLLPSFVQDANNKYSEKKDAIFRDIKEIVKSFDDSLNYQLQLAEFDKLRFMLNEGKNREAWFEIPEDLMKRNADMTAYPDCVPNLIVKMRESSDTARVAEAKLNTLLSKLRAIDLPRLKTDEGFIMIQKELEKLADHLDQAKANNVSLNKAIAQHSGNLQLLTLPCSEMWAKIVPADDEDDRKKRTSMSSEEMQVRKMVDKIMEMQSQRKSLIDQLESDLRVDDISNKLIGTNEKGAEEMMTSEITKHVNIQQLIRLNVTAQDAILRAFADANADFFEERSSMSEKKKEYEMKVAELCASYEVYRDVAKKVDEGENFYRQLMARCDQFAIPVHIMEEQYREELEKKEKAKKEAELHMNQLRMTREAHNALMDFGGAASLGVMGSSGPGSSTGLPIPPPSRGPRLGDYLDSYRARKQVTQMEKPVDTPHGGAPFIHGPPSPTPSSICDFPISSRSQSQRFSGGGLPDGTSLNYGGYAPHQFPVPAQRPYGVPTPPIQPSSNPSQGQYQPAPYQAPPAIPPNSAAYQHASTPLSGDTGSYQVPRLPPLPIHNAHIPQGSVSYEAGLPPVAAGAPSPAPGQHYVPGQVPYSSGTGGQYQNPPTSSYAPSPVNFAPVQRAVQPGPHGNHQALLTSTYTTSPINGAPGQIIMAEAKGSLPQYQTPPSSQGAQPSPPMSSQASSSLQRQYQVPSPIQRFQQTQYSGPGVQSQFQAPLPGPGVQSQFQAPPPGPGVPSQFQAPPPGPGVQSQFQAPPPGPGVQSQFQAPPPGPGVQSQFQAPPPGPGVQSQYQAPLAGPGAQSQGQALLTGPGAQSQFQAPPPVQRIQQAPPPPASFAPTSFSAPQVQGLQNAPYSGTGLQPQYQSLPTSSAPTPLQEPRQAPPPASLPVVQPPFHQSGPPTQPCFQQPPHGGPISSQPPISQQNQHFAPPTAAQGTLTVQASRFTPTPDAPSPWHATPTALKTPWNTTPQYHAQAPSAPSSQTSQDSARAQPSSGVAPGSRSNMDLLSDLLGDFNMSPTIQPTVQNAQHLQKPSQSLQQVQEATPRRQEQAPPPQSVFQVSANSPDLPGKAYGRPAAAVQPMVQQTPPLSQIAQQQAGHTQETPILVNSSPSITELSDPSKFQLGEGNAQKLEKRMLHHSFRTNGPPPPLNQADPLNQIDAFGFVNRQI